MINGGVRQNIISETCTMQGTIRTLDSEMQKIVHEKIKQTATMIAAASGATAEVMIETKTLVTYNTPELVKQMVPTLERTLGAANVGDTNWVITVPRRLRSFSRSAVCQKGTTPRKHPRIIPPIFM
jgi:amidohydrolase